jgi:hypothetical protein
MFVTDVLLETTCNHVPNCVREVRGEKIGRVVLEGGHGVNDVHQNHRSRSSVSATPVKKYIGLEALWVGKKGREGRGECGL